MLCTNTSFIYVIYSNVACSSRTTRHPAPPQPIPCQANFVICITFGESRGGGAGGVAGGTGERFILKQFKIFSCNYMSTSRKSRQDNDKNNGENGARSTATAARLFIGKHKHKYVYKYAYKYAYKHRCKWQTQIQRTDACAFLDMFEYRRRYLHIASFELGTEHREKIRNVLVFEFLHFIQRCV